MIREAFIALVASLIVLLGYCSPVHAQEGPTIGFIVNDSLSVYGSVRYTDDDIGKKFDVTSAYLIHTRSVLDLEVTTQHKSSFTALQAIYSF